MEESVLTPYQYLSKVLTNELKMVFFQKETKIYYKTAFRLLRGCIIENEKDCYDVNFHRILISNLINEINESNFVKTFPKWSFIQIGLLNEKTEILGTKSFVIYCGLNETETALLKLIS